MNLPEPLRRLLQLVLPARSPQRTPPRTAEHAKGITRPEPPPARDWDDETNPGNRTKWLPVETARARIRDRVDQFPPAPAAPTGPLPSEAEPIRPRQVPDNSAPEERWDKR